MVHRFRFPTLLALAVALIALGIVSSGGAGAAGPPDGNGLDHAIAVQEGHTDALMAKEGVVGTAVGLGEDGKPVILILTEAAGVAGLPRSLDGVQVVVKVTGKIFALHHRPDHCDGPPGAELDPSCDTGGGNTAPVADDQSVTTPEDTNVTITLTGSDADGCDTTSFTFSATSPTGGSLSATSGSMTCSDPGALAANVTYNPDLTTTSDSFNFTISDGTDTSNTATVSITVGSAISFPRPANIGTSSGTERLITSGGQLFCTTGTLGVRVSAGNNVFALSNAHVYALEGSTPGGTVTTGPTGTGDRILQPGRVDLPSGGCGTADEIDAAEIGNLAAFKSLIFDNGTACSTGTGPGEGINDPDCNTIDAAIASTTAAMVGTSTPADGYGLPKSAIVSAALGQDVQKYGRTTDLTTGSVAGINATVTVCYDTGCAKFVGQVIVDGDRGGFIKGGDSGSLLVAKGGTDDRSPVGLLFAGSRSGKTAIANPIDLVLAKFGVTVNGE